MNYQEMSDFEINCRLHFRNYDKLRFEKGKFYYSTKSGREMVIGKYLYKFDSPDYCNSWADAGPIIQENKISIIHDCMAEPQDGGCWLARPTYGYEHEKARSDNPLRAAMVLFLMMKDKK